MPVNDAFATARPAGMVVRSKVTLSDLHLVKLGHRFLHGSRQDDGMVLSSPWWFTPATVELICRSVGASDSGLSDAFRRFGAIARRWGGSADLIVKARLKAAVTAYIGPGTIQDFRGIQAQEGHNLWDLPLWVPSASIPQVNIPLMAKGKPETSVVGEAFDHVYIVPIDKWDTDYLHAAPPEKFRVI
jgi:hypothetical protein